MKRTLNKESAKKINQGGESFPAASFGIGTRNLSITSLYQLTYPRAQAYGL